MAFLDAECDADGFGPPGKAVTSTGQEEIYNGDSVRKGNRVFWEVQLFTKIANGV